MAKSYFYDEGIADWRELVKGEQGERGPQGPVGPQGPAIDVETGLPITVDTSVGTRVFVGDVMIHGDTGWRRIDFTGKFPDYPSLNYLHIRRENSMIYMRFRASLSAGDEPYYEMYALPLGWRPPTGRAAGSIQNAYTGRHVSNHSSFTVFENTVSLSPETTLYRLQGNMTYMTNDPWPTSLPGTPG